MISIGGKRIRLNENARIRDVPGDPFIFFDSGTCRIDAIPSAEGSLERRILRLFAEKVKTSHTNDELLELVSETLTLKKEKFESGLMRLMQRLLAKGILRVEN